MRIVALMLASALAACSGNQPAASPEQPTGPVLQIGGSDTLMAKLMPRLAETHEKARGTMRFELSAGGSTEGMSRLLSGDLDLAASSRHHMGYEQDQAVQNGTSLAVADARVIVGVDVVVVAVHPNNPTNALTYDQVVGIFCTRTIDNWSFLGQDDRPIRPITRGPSTGTRALFEDFFCGPSGIHRTVEEGTSEQIGTALASDPSSISFVSLSDELGKALALRPEAAGPPVTPSQQNIISGAYPLYRDLYLYGAGPITGRAKDFTDWVQSPAGQEVVDEARFVPLFLRPERLDEPRPLRETVHFDAGSSDPNQRSMARLKLLVDELDDRQFRHVILEGFTDSEEPNPFELSQGRADTVRTMLQQKMPELYFEMIPRGAKNPIAPNNTPYGRQRNRRVQVYLAEEETDEPPRPAGG